MLIQDTATRPFVNPFQVEDLLVFNSASLCRVIEGCLRKMSIEHLGWALQDAPPPLLWRLRSCISPELLPIFLQQWRRKVPQFALERARRQLLNEAFWELTYWKAPDLYEELTVGEYLHPGIFQQLEPYLSEKVVVDAGAGSGRATFEMIRYGARLVYAVEPSDGLLRLLRAKREASLNRERIVPYQGDFAHLPLPDASVDLALACSAFTSDAVHGGEAGLAELKRVVRAGGSIVLIWPRREDLPWLKERGFRHITLAGADGMCVHFPSSAVARRCIRRFYAGKRSALAYLFQQPCSSVVPFSVLGFNPPCDYCMLADL